MNLVQCDCCGKIGPIDRDGFYKMILPIVLPAAAYIREQDICDECRMKIGKFYYSLRHESRRMKSDDKSK